MIKIFLRNASVYFLLVVFCCAMLIPNLKAQGYLLNEDKVKAFVLSERFNQYGVLRTSGVSYPNKKSFVADLPTIDSWVWQFNNDSIAIDMQIDQHTHTICFKNNIQGYTGLDKSELGVALVLRLKHTEPITDSVSENTTRSAPNDTMFGILYHISFFTNEQPDYGIGSALKCLWREFTDGKNAKAFTLVIPQYGFTRDSMAISPVQLNRALEGERWDFWMGMQDDVLLLYAKNAFFDYAHMFFVEVGQNNIPVVEWHGYIPTDNVRELFVKYIEKPDGRGIEVR